MAVLPFCWYDIEAVWMPERQEEQNSGAICGFSLKKAYRSCSLLWLFIKVFNQSQRTFHTELADVDQQLVGIGAAPVLIGIRLIVILSSPVCPLDRGGRLLFRQIVAVHNPFDAVLHGSADEDIQTAGILPENVVRAPADDDTGPALCQAFDDG